MLQPIKIKKSKIKQRRRRIALILIIVISVLILYAIFHARNYEKNYQINEFDIKEKFDKGLNVYTFEVKKEDKTFHFAIEHKYITKRKLLTNIEWLEKEDTICIIPKSKSLTAYPQCIKEDLQIDYHLINEPLKEELKSFFYDSKNAETETYEKIDIKNLDNATYYIWNYKGFYRINKNTKEKISLFDKDIYNISNVASVKGYLVIPDYNASYYFNKFYLINMKDGSNMTWDFKDSIYFDGYYLGTHNDSLFYVDKKTKIEWEFWPKKKKMRKIGTENKEGKIYKNNNWEKISLTKLTSENIYFEYEEIYHYEIENGLYVKYTNCESKKKISEKNVKEIIAQNQDKVYYLVGDSLYYYSEATGEIEIMSYFEWNFNYKNMIFIY